MLESIFFFIAENKKFLARATTLIAVCVSIIFYLYISFIFSCVYVGLAKIQGITWSWSQSFVTSLYIPLAFTNLPRNFPIEFVGGLHGIAVLTLGYNVFLRHLNSRFERIAIAAAELRGSFEDRILRVKLSLIQEKASRSSVGEAPGTLQSVTADASNSIVMPSEKLSTRKGFRQPRKNKGR